MEDLFDLNDFEDKPEITPDAPTPIAANGIKDKELLTKEEPKIEEKKEKEEQDEYWKETDEKVLNKKKKEV